MGKQDFENECQRRFKMTSNQYIELLSIKDIRDVLMSLLESQSEINRLKELSYWYWCNTSTTDHLDEDGINKLNKFDKLMTEFENKQDENNKVTCKQRLKIG